MLCICCNIRQQIYATAQTDALPHLLASSLFIQKSLSPSPHLFFIMVYHSKNKQTQNTFIKTLFEGLHVLQCVPLALLTVESQTATGSYCQSEKL